MSPADRLEPFRLQPIFVERPWGGQRLGRFGKALPPDVRIGESWELVDLPQEVVPGIEDPSSPVLDGPFAGERLHTAVAEAGPALLGDVPATSDGRFPLLFKLLDAEEHLSVQVHPHEAYVAIHPEVRLKTESWYVVDAEPGSVLYLDVAPGTTAADVDAVMGTPGIVSLLHERQAVRGAFHHVPAGLVHALGAGTVVAEVQTPSDTTFRIYDWAAEYGRAPRQLHPAESSASIRIHPAESFSLEPMEHPGVRELVHDEHYTLREHRLPGGPSQLARAGAIVVCVVAGQARLGALELPMGTTAVVPASSAARTLEGDGAIVLEIGLGARTEA